MYKTVFIIQSIVNYFVGSDTYMHFFTTNYKYFKTKRVEIIRSVNGYHLWLDKFCTHTTSIKANLKGVF